MTEFPEPLRHVHCWHATNRWLTTSPPQAVEVCCECGGERHLPIRVCAENPEGHGPFFPRNL